MPQSTKEISHIIPEKELNKDDDAGNDSNKEDSEKSDSGKSEDESEKKSDELNHLRNLTQEEIEEILTLRANYL
jgi:hypothetical protein